MNVSKQQKWTIFWGWLGFVVLILAADMISYMLGKSGAIADSTVTSLHRNVPGVLFLLFMAFMLLVLRKSEVKK